MADVNDPGSPIAWLALEPGTLVAASDGTLVGQVEEVHAEPDVDIFEGLVVQTARGPRFVDADLVADLYERLVRLRITVDEVARLPEPRPAPRIIDVEPP